MNQKVVHNFANAINSHDVDAICTFMTDDHKFTDSHGNETVGKDKMRAGWIGYFQLFPDYQIEITEIFENGDIVTAFGFASGTFMGSNISNENHWRLPASWRVIVKNGKIQFWQVYADTKIPFDIIARNSKQ